MYIRVYLGIRTERRDRISIGNREKKSRRWEGSVGDLSPDPATLVMPGREVRPGWVKTCSIEGEKMGAHLMMPRCASPPVQFRSVIHRPL